MRTFRLNASGSSGFSRPPHDDGSSTTSETTSECRCRICLWLRSDTRHTHRSLSRCPIVRSRTAGQLERNRGILKRPRAFGFPAGPVPHGRLNAPGSSTLPSAQRRGLFKSELERFGGRFLADSRGRGLIRAAPGRPRSCRRRRSKSQWGEHRMTPPPAGCDPGRGGRRQCR
jgi:hypothetical protein